MLWRSWIRERLILWQTSTEIQQTEITNTGTAFTEFALIETESGFPFFVIDQSCGFGLDPGTACTVAVVFESVGRLMTDLKSVL